MGFYCFWSIVLKPCGAGFFLQFCVELHHSHLICSFGFDDLILCRDRSNLRTLIRVYDWQTKDEKTIYSTNYSV